MVSACQISMTDSNPDLGKIPALLLSYWIMVNVPNALICCDSFVTCQL